MTGVRTWLAGARPRTWPASLVPPFVGTAASDAAAEGAIVWWRAVCALVVSLFIQIAVNYANDYSDGVRGTDVTRVGPQRLVASGAASPNAVRNAAFAAFGAAAAVGMVVAAAVSWWLIVAGAASMLAAWYYTGGRRPYGYRGLGELFVFVFFGLVATAGSAFVQDAHLTVVGLAASVPVGLGSVALLISNNLRDLPTDEQAGKRTLAVRVGDRPTRAMYVAVVFIVVISPLYLSLLRPWAILALASAMVAISPVRTVLRGATGAALVAVLAGTGRLQLVVGALLTVGLALGV
ncbi:1,4-dihydroxy-2-naphthoate polyprenyltransferase [Candidatus Poriferisodalis sp.]|uniref:1,4-dihydroxy-2-naphthoate polyprenyltransferase n=1 Tax=Candidatus Poriferisodalis sp. TaxID=3101277 RepID=UPI003C6F2C30